MTRRCIERLKVNNLDKRRLTFLYDPTQVFSEKDP